jgi:hypothetical protein
MMGVSSLDRTTRRIAGAGSLVAGVLATYWLVEMLRQDHDWAIHVRANGSGLGVALRIQLEPSSRARLWRAGNHDLRGHSRARRHRNSRSRALAAKRCATQPAMSDRLGDILRETIARRQREEL